MQLLQKQQRSSHENRSNLFKSTSICAGLLAVALLAGCGSSGTGGQVQNDAPQTEAEIEAAAVAEAEAIAQAATIAQALAIIEAAAIAEAEAVAQALAITNAAALAEAAAIAEAEAVAIAEAEAAALAATEAEALAIAEAEAAALAAAEAAASPPTSPGQVLSIEYSGFDIEIFWTRSTDNGWVMGYDIYRNDELLSPMLDALSFYDDAVQPETEYTYSVIAVDEHGNRSETSTVVLTTPADRPAGENSANTATLMGDAGSARWDISDGLGTTNDLPSGGSCIFGNGAGSGVGISDANLPGNFDAFDLGSLMWVNGEQVGGWLRSSTDSTSNFASVPMSDLQVATEYHAISSQATLRNLTSFNNATPNDISVIINHATNFGSDGRTYISASSSGDLNFDQADRWVITDDYATDGDPANTTVFFGPDSPVSNTVFTSQTVFSCAGNQGLNVRIDLTIPAGERRSLMFFHSLSTTSPNAVDAVSQFNTTPRLESDLLEGLNAGQLQEVANWAF